MKRVAVLGHFAFGKDKANGQTVKTKIVASELQKVVGEAQVDCHDTMGGWRFFLTLPKVLLHLLQHYENIIFLPAYKGVRVIVPLLAVLNLFFHRRLHYVVIGGWLPDYVDKYHLLRITLRRIDYIYVETRHMQDALLQHRYKGVKLLPNFKPLSIVKSDDLLSFNSDAPYPLCTFSRVMREKGIEDAIEAVRHCNEQAGKTLFTLDIYGQIEHKQTHWFEQLMCTQPDYIRYGGIVPYAESTSVLRKHFALLFPTRFKTEGFAGTIIDAMSAGLPSVATDCTSNKELIIHGKTGLLYPIGDVAELCRLLNVIAQKPDIILAMRTNCLKKAQDYLPDKVITTLSEELK